MNQRLKYSILFILFGTITFLSTKLWDATYGHGITNTLSVVLTFALGVFTFVLFVKIIKPQEPIIKMIADFLSGL